MEGIKPTKEMLLLDTPEDQVTPQEVKDWEKPAQDTKNEGQNPLSINSINDTEEEKVQITSTETEVQKYKEFNTNYLILNNYWINLVSKISFFLSMVMIETVGLFVFSSIFDLFEGEYETTKETLIFLIEDVGVKWIVIISICQHLSIAFFSLSNFSNILKETKETSKFFRSTLIKAAFFYFVSIIILKGIIEESIFEPIKNKIINLEDMSEENKNKVLPIINDVKRLALRYTGNLLGNFNNNLDKLLFGFFYICLFSSPKFINEKYLIYFRFLSILPIIYIILSLIFRSLNNLGKITISSTVSPLLVGPKITIFGFFFSVLYYIKRKEKRYKMYDEEGYLIPSIFAKLSSKIFTIFGMIEFISGLFFPSFTQYGMGGNYLIIISAPLLILYDYKKNYELHIRPCKSRDSGKCISYTFTIISNSIIIICGLAIAGYIIAIVEDHLMDMATFIVDNLKDILVILVELNVV